MNDVPGTQKFQLIDDPRDIEAAAAVNFNVRLSKGGIDVALERLRQIEQEGFTTEHDDHHAGGSLSLAAVCYTELASAQIRGANAAEFNTDVANEMGWPWEDEAWKPKDTRRNLVRAAALIIAEIDRLDREVASDE